MPQVTNPARSISAGFLWGSWVGHPHLSSVVYWPSHYLNPSVRRGDLRLGQYSPSQFVESALEGNGALTTSGETKHRLFMLVLVIAIVLAMTGWVYALGWVALKLI